MTRCCNGKRRGGGGSNNNNEPGGHDPGRQRPDPQHRTTLLGRGGLYSERAYTVTYDSRSNAGVILQMWGSVWPNVMPYCLWNCLADVVLQLLKAYKVLDLTISDKGHTFINLVMGFLMVSRLNVALNRYNEARKHLAVMFTETRECVQQACVYSLAKGETSEPAKQWRNDVAYRIMLLLRSIQALLDYPSRRQPVCTYIADDSLRKEIEDKLYVHSPEFSHGVQRGEFEENIRIPQMLEWKVRETIQQHYKVFANPFIIHQERSLQMSVDRFMQAWTGSRYLLTTPHPFPLVQMTRTFLFLYVFTLPFALLSDVTSPIGHVLTVFIITYGFVGLEMVAIELDDPFGDSDNNFDNLRMAYTCFEDIYLMILDANGLDYAVQLRRKMDDAYAELTMPEIQEQENEATPLVTA